ncbi:MAG: SDR family NAD(P)-dependent oxidoreductase [Planctomycetota bacterium]
MKEQRLAVVTGGSRGLGAALVERYVERGWSVLELSRSGAERGLRHERVEHVRLDLAEPEAARRTVAEELERRLAARPTELHFVNNAAALEPVGPQSADGPPGWSEHLTVNVLGGIGVMGAFLAAAEALPARKVLANVSSGAATSAIRGWSLYCASKAGLDHFVRTVALEQADREHPTLAVNVAPGVVDTAMQTTIRSVDPVRFPDRERFVELFEQGQLRSPDQTARLFLERLAGELENGASYRL